MGQACRPRARELLRAKLRTWVDLVSFAAAPVALLLMKRQLVISAREPPVACGNSRRPRAWLCWTCIRVASTFVL
jgi:hypothetical protein